MLHELFITLCTLLHIDNWNLFLQCNAVIFIPASVGKTDQLGHLPSQIHIESNSNINLCPVLYLKLTYAVLSLLGRRQMDLGCLFLVNNRQHMPICTKTVLLGLGKFRVSQRHICLLELSVVLWCLQLRCWSFPGVHPAGW